MPSDHSLSLECNSELEEEFSKCKSKLIEFLSSHKFIEYTVNINVIKKHFKVPFDSFPQNEEILQVLDKIVQRNLGKSSLQKQWFLEDMQLLVWLVIQHSLQKLLDNKHFKMHDWNFLSEIIPFKSAEQCKYKWMSLERINLSINPWTIEEDTILKNLVIGKTSKKWSEIAINLYVQSGEIIFRAGKYCRERWNNHLSPNLKKGFWSLKEDIKLIEAIQKHGKKWCDVSKVLCGRTENGVKNRYNSLIIRWTKIRKSRCSKKETEEGKMMQIYQNLLLQLNDDELMQIQNQKRINMIVSLKKGKAFHRLEEIKSTPKINLLYEILESQYPNYKRKLEECCQNNLDFESFLQKSPIKIFAKQEEIKKEPNNNANIVNTQNNVFLQNMLLKNSYHKNIIVNQRPEKNIFLISCRRQNPYCMTTYQTNILNVNPNFNVFNLF